MNLIEMTDYLLKNLLKEKRKYGRIAIPKDIEGKKILIRHLMNVREALPVSDDFLNIQDKYLKTINNKTTDVDNLAPVSIDSRLILWQGDITTLNADAIVNAANNQILGCFIPGHRCIEYPFETMTREFKNSNLVRINKSDSRINENLKNKAISLGEDIIKVLGKLLNK